MLFQVKKALSESWGHCDFLAWRLPFPWGRKKQADCNWLALLCVLSIRNEHQVSKHSREVFVHQTEMNWWSRRWWTTATRKMQSPCSNERAACLALCRLRSKSPGNRSSRKCLLYQISQRDMAFKFCWYLWFVERREKKMNGPLVNPLGSRIKNYIKVFMWLCQMCKIHGRSSCKAIESLKTGRETKFPGN